MRTGNCEDEILLRFIIESIKNRKKGTYPDFRDSWTLEWFVVRALYDKLHGSLDIKKIRHVARVLGRTPATIQKRLENFAAHDASLVGKTHKKYLRCPSDKRFNLFFFSLPSSKPLFFQAVVSSARNGLNLEGVI
jgi:hypothetical protein